MNEATRYDQDKNRLDLVPPILTEEVGKVLTFGCKKYYENDWMKGMKWSRCIGSLKRHLNEFEKGVDFDNESGINHLSHLITNAMFLLSYYDIHPELDDRVRQPKKRIALDIDDVLANFCKNWCELYGLPEPTSWSFDRDIGERLSTMEKEGKLNDFYLDLPVLTQPQDIPFEPIAYVTSRPVSSEITQQWLHNNGFPAAPVYTVGIHGSKVDILKEIKADIFVDDRMENFIELNKAGICTYLFDAPHNQRYDVGYRRIYDLKSLK